MDVVIGIDLTCWLAQPDSWCGDTCPAKTTLINHAAVYLVFITLSYTSSCVSSNFVYGSCRTAGGVR